MPMLLRGSCRCAAVQFEVSSHTPVPYQLCYCSICRKQQGGGGYAINLGGDAKSLSISGDETIGIFNAEIEDDEHPHCQTSSAERRYCKNCGSALWLYDPSWPELVHPFASAIDSDLPPPPQRVHLMLKYKASWVEPCIREGDATFDLYPEESLEAWHRRHALWIE
jgi:hypothetical protein